MGILFLQFIYLFWGGLKSFFTAKLGDLMTGKVVERTRTTCWVVLVYNFMIISLYLREGSDGAMVSMCNL